MFLAAVALPSCLAVLTAVEAAAATNADCRQGLSQPQGSGEKSLLLISLQWEVSADSPGGSDIQNLVHADHPQRACSALLESTWQLPVDKQIWLRD